jgi:hypothetical protein
MTKGLSASWNKLVGLKLVLPPFLPVPQYYVVGTPFIFPVFFFVGSRQSVGNRFSPGHAAGPAAGELGSQSRRDEPVGPGRAAAAATTVSSSQHLTRTDNRVVPCSDQLHQLPTDRRGTAASAHLLEPFDTLVHLVDENMVRRMTVICQATGILIILSHQTTVVYQTQCQQSFFYNLTAILP